MAEQHTPLNKMYIISVASLTFVLPVVAALVELSVQHTVFSFELFAK